MPGRKHIFFIIIIYLKAFLFLKGGAKVKKIHLFIMFVLSVILLNSSILLAQDNQKGKLGFGFDPGLVAGKDYVAGQLIVGIKKGRSTRSTKIKASAAKGTVVKEIKKVALLLQFTSEDAVIAAANALKKLPSVAFVERNGFMSIPPEPIHPGLKGKSARRTDKNDMENLSVSIDPGTGYQWHHTVIRKTANLGALSATPPTVAVLDTGVDYTHPDLSGKVILGRNCIENNFDPFDDHGHGTHVAGIIAAKAANNMYGEGVCPNAKILAVKVLAGTGSGSYFDIATGMAYTRSVAASITPRVRVINMSLGGYGNSSLLSNEVLAIKNAGLVLVAAAGNDNTTTPMYPGAYPNTALRVVATEQNDYRTWFSNFSPVATPSQYNIAAPGWEIPSTTPGAGYEPMSGTSMASPVVAGAAALVWGQIPALTRDQLIARLVNNGKLLPAGISSGFPVATRRLDVRQALLGTTERAIVGRILDPFTGKAPSSPITPTTARLFSGATQLATDLTNSGGAYEMTGLGAGTARRLLGNKTGYPNTQIRTGITIASVAGPFTDALPKARPSGQVTITLDWRSVQPFSTAGCPTCEGWQLDLVVKRPDGTYTYGNGDRGDLLTAPYVACPRDSEDNNDYEPLETIVISNLAQNGIYKVFVWNVTSNPWAGSGASVQLYNGAANLGPFYAAPPAAAGTLPYWHIGNLTKTGSAYTWTNVNTATSTLP
ncbi:MAG: hypothetical protein AYP45_12185 [Candidatus Brocadia carolinensis]|uniref:Uncharacterized protein n=1 Tax=Candidatus Brocadia carolinensis TaxID=1004156 RepID=A0A1V4ARZ0_9BACT|nr:MAG: hypothetical protein AYP45_12185 [Candidatus Brocadia caroliniensis]